MPLPGLIQAGSTRSTISVDPPLCLKILINPRPWW
jgi:hypothetical protein